MHCCPARARVSGMQEPVSTAQRRRELTVQSGVPIPGLSTNNAGKGFSGIAVPTSVVLCIRARCNDPYFSSRPEGLAVAPPDSWWGRALRVVLDEVRGLVRVSRIEQPDAVLLAPEHVFFLRENLKLKLLNARLGVLARQLDSARADLASASFALGKYFDPSSRRTQAAAGQLQQIQAQMKVVELPRVDETLAALATAAAGR